MRAQFTSTGDGCLIEASLLRGWRSTGRLGLRTLRREWRAGEFKVLAAALIVAVGAIVAVSAFTDRMDRGMRGGASELLAADLVLSSTQPIGKRYEAALQSRQLRSARALSMRSVVLAGDRLQLARVKAVSPNYPLRGSLRTAATAYGQDAVTTGIPQAGTVWVEARLLGLLGLQIGDYVELGSLRARVARVLTYEPDRGGALFNIAPRVLMHLDDVPKTALVQPASRVRHRLYMAGAADSIGSMRDWLNDNRATVEELQGVRDARPEFRAALDRAERFLGLAAMVSVLLAGVAIAVAARRHAERHLDTAAMLRCLGLSQAGVMQVFIVQLVALGVVASAIGCTLGYAAQLGLGELMGGMLLTELPAASFAPAGHGFATGLICLVGFGLPPLVGLGQVSPLRVLRRDLAGLSSARAASYGAATLALAVLILWQAKEPRLAAYVLGGGLATVLLLSVGAWVLVMLLGRLRTRVGVAWRFGIANIARRATASMVQIVAFGLGIMVLLLLVVVRADLVEGWVENLPADTPNVFLVNVQAKDIKSLSTFLDTAGIDFGALHPMVRGRLVAVNGRAVKPSDYADPRAQRLAARDFNLSWAATLPPGNRIVAGSYWDPPPDSPATRKGMGSISVEEGLAQALGLAMGDQLDFMIAGQRASATITNLREVHWDSFQVNFFVIFTPAELADKPATFISSFYVSPDKRPALVDLIRHFPGVTVIDADALLIKVRELMERATLAVEYVFIFTLLAGFAVLFAATQATLDERRFEAAVVRTLGATRGRVTSALLAEFALLGLLAGALAAFAASALGQILAVFVFDLPFTINPWVWVAGLAGGAIGVTTAGWLGTRSVLNAPPLTTIREG